MLNNIHPVPTTPVEPITEEVIHGVPILDPYRWLEDQEDPRTRAWLGAQILHSHKHLDGIPGRQQILSRIRELLDVESYDSVQKRGDRYFFRKRSKGKEQACICLRRGTDGPDEVLVDPAKRRTGSHTAVQLLSVSSDGGLLLYGIKQGGERAGEFEVFNVRTRETLPDSLPHGFLRGFAFESDCRSFYYIHRSSVSTNKYRPVVYRHVLGTAFGEDIALFAPDGTERIDLYLVPGIVELGVLVTHMTEKRCVDFLLIPKDESSGTKSVIEGAESRIRPLSFARWSNSRVYQSPRGESKNC